MSAIRADLRGRVWSTIVLALALAASARVAIAQDVNNGRHVFRKCAVCHVTNPTSTELLAPPLNDIVGRRAATIPGFEYSDIMTVAGKAGLIWTPQALFYFLDRPEAFIPGTYMVFSGLDEQERRDVIAYLEALTKATKSNRSSLPPPPPARTAPPPSRTTLAPPPSTAAKK